MAIVNLMVEVTQVHTNKPNHTLWRTRVIDHDNPSTGRMQMVEIDDYNRNRWGISDVYKATADMARAVIMDSRLGS